MGRSMEDDCILNYVAPSKDSTGKPFVAVPRSDILPNTDKWKDMLVGYVLGDKPFYMRLKACVGTLWKPTCSLVVHSRDNGYFFFKFGDSFE